MRTGPYIQNPSHVLGILTDTALGIRSEFTITGDDYPTRDGTGIRDYLHVWDLAMAHLKALENFDSALSKSDNDYCVINLGSGNGVTVKELVTAFETVWGSPINKSTGPRRPGDVAGAYASAEKAKELINWQTELSIADGISDALKWTDHIRPDLLGY